MRQLVYLAFSVVLLSLPLSGDDRARKWITPPDGFAWPESPKAAPNFKLETRKLDELNDALRKTAITQLKGPGKDAPELTTLAECDLNGDGENEVFLLDQRLSGTAGYFYAILTPDGETYRQIGSFQAAVVKFVAKKNGWYQIEVASRGGPSDYVRGLFCYTEGSYKQKRAEAHDFAKKKMVVHAGKMAPAGSGK